MFGPLVFIAAHAAAGAVLVDTRETQDRVVGQRPLLISWLARAPGGEGKALQHVKGERVTRRDLRSGYG
jgi:hypothetical protein